MDFLNATMERNKIINSHEFMSPLLFAIRSSLRRNLSKDDLVIVFNTCNKIDPLYFISYYKTKRFTDKITELLIRKIKYF